MLDTCGLPLKQVSMGMPPKQQGIMHLFEELHCSKAGKHGPRHKLVPLRTIWLTIDAQLDAKT